MSSVFITVIIFLCLVATSCKAQPTSIVGGPCEGCEAIHESGNRPLRAVDTLPGFMAYEPKLKISGTVYQRDGKTPAEGVILYIYQTNTEGIYPQDSSAKGWGLSHGLHRGWIKTGKDGRYSFYTFQPGAYPGRTDPAHIHLTVKEPGKNEYYLDDYQFENDPLLTSAKRNGQPNRGGSGILRTMPRNGILEAERNIILGLNIPGY